jgi:hypothetical protein
VPETAAYSSSTSPQRPSLPELPELPPPVRRHLEALSDEIGILQHAVGRAGDPGHGYCTDDVSRALEVDLLQARSLGWSAVQGRARRNLRFLQQAYMPSQRRFRNFRGVDGAWRDEGGSDDCQGRAVLALGTVVAMCPDRRVVAAARELLLHALPGTDGLRSPRAVASCMLGIDAALGAGETSLREPLETRADRLATAFEGLTDDWYWPEATLTYENALLPRALIAAGSRLGERTMVNRGLRALDWLLAVQTAPDQHFSPVGNGWWQRNGVKSRFDQQPIEATALLRACSTAFAITGETRFRRGMERSFAWFLGANDVGVRVADPQRGSCCDGVTPSGVNRNEGAESTLVWLIAVEEMRELGSRSSPRATAVTSRVSVAA